MLCFVVSNCTIFHVINAVILYLMLHYVIHDVYVILHDIVHQSLTHSHRRLDWQAHGAAPVMVLRVLFIVVYTQGWEVGIETSAQPEPDLLLLGMHRQHSRPPQ